jgi:hypothetical protein
MCFDESLPFPGDVENPSMKLGAGKTLAAHSRRLIPSNLLENWKSLLKVLFPTDIAIALGFQTQKCLLHL